MKVFNFRLILFATFDSTVFKYRKSCNNEIETDDHVFPCNPLNYCQTTFLKLPPTKILLFLVFLYIKVIVFLGNYFLFCLTFRCLCHVRITVVQIATIRIILILICNILLICTSDQKANMFLEGNFFFYFLFNNILL